MRTLEVWEERRGVWRWRYLDEGMEAISNRVFASRSDAEESARLSYPGVAVRRRSGRSRGRLPRRAVVVAAVAAAGLAAMVRRRRPRTVRVRPVEE